MSTCLDCDRPPLWMGRCKPHYNKWRIRVADADPSKARCSTKRCARAAYVSGLCRVCYGNQWKAKQPKKPKVAKVKPVKLCHCGAKFYAMGLCVNHWRQEQRTAKRAQLADAGLLCYCGHRASEDGLCYKHNMQAQASKRRAEHEAEVEARLVQRIADMKARRASLYGAKDAERMAKSELARERILAALAKIGKCRHGHMTKTPDDCGRCKRNEPFRCADTNWRHEWVVRMGVVYCRVCKYVKGPL